MSFKTSLKLALSNWRFQLVILAAFGIVVLCCISLGLIPVFLENSQGSSTSEVIGLLFSKFKNNQIILNKYNLFRGKNNCHHRKFGGF